MPMLPLNRADARPASTVRPRPLRQRATLLLLSATVTSCGLALTAAGASASPLATSCAATVALSAAIPAPQVSYPPAPVTVSRGGVEVRALVKTGGEAAAVFVRLSSNSTPASCSSPVSVPAHAGAVPVRVQLTGLDPATTYRFEVAAATAGGTSFGRSGSFRTPAAVTIAPGVRLGPLELGGTSPQAAAAKLESFLAAPVHFGYAGAYWSVSRASLGAALDPATLASRALAAAPDAHLRLGLTVDRSRLDAYLSGLDRRFAHSARRADVRLLGSRALVVPAAAAVRVDVPAMAARIEAALSSGSSARLGLLVTSSAVSVSSAAKAVVVRLQSQTLTAYLNGKPVLHTPVTTGRPALPTPVGSYRVIFHASPFVFHSPWPPGSPYWYPPTPVNWAMDFFGGDFLHDDPGEPTSAFGAGSEDGPYASHGCVHVPHSVMAFLYRWLPNGAQVVVAND
jgi:lipoprotein-anchoring transpeptidase ErfK/SrfK